MSHFFIRKLARNDKPNGYLLFGIMLQVRGQKWQKKNALTFSRKFYDQFQQKHRFKRNLFGLYHSAKVR